jgi:exosortase E/protease (VPEID-CTERM system)
LRHRYTETVNASIVAQPSLNQRLQSLPLRLAILAAIFLLEKVLLHFLVDVDAAQTAEGLAAFVRDAQSQAFHLVTTVFACLVLFSYVRSKKTGTRVFDFPAPTNIRVRWLILHALLVLPLAPLAFSLFRYPPVDPRFAALAVLSACFVTAAVLAAFRAMAPWSTWREAARRLGHLWIYAALVGAMATWAMLWVQKLWRPAAALTFELVRLLLKPLLPTLTADPSRLILSTDNFSVGISDGCSGLEGMGLMLAFCVGWLLLFRTEYRFPRALVLVPIGLLLVFALNALRIAALVLIGQAGYPDVAEYGFHTQAGWIGFTCAAGAVVLLSRRSSWMNRCAGAGDVPGDNPTAAYLVPFLAMQAAGILALAMSGGFDALYSLRLVAGVAALAYYRSRVMALEWRFSWRGPVAGVAVFVVWVFAAKLLLIPTEMPRSLTALSPILRFGWIASRALTTIAIVPIAEELAFRGYLLRRFVSADFESVPFAAVRWPILVLTSALFGINHGVMWAAGIIAGLIYGLLVCRTGRIGESVAAHATTNGLLAALVILGGQWQYW